MKSADSAQAFYDGLALRYQDAHISLLAVLPDLAALIRAERASERERIVKLLRDTDPPSYSIVDDEGDDHDIIPWSDSIENLIDTIRALPDES